MLAFALAAIILLLGAGVVVSLQFANFAIEQVKVEGLHRDYSLCVNGNKRVQGLREFILEATQFNGPDVTEGDRRFLDLSDKFFTPTPCPPKPPPVDTSFSFFG